MKREIEMSEVSDGKRYTSNDLVKISCNDCKGCSKCCHGMGTSIILDPYDIYQLTKVTGKTFNELIDSSIELNLVDSIILPNIKMQTATDACYYLDSAGRCSIHNNRPGICRLFPLGRIYENAGFTYFNQIYECDYPNKSKIKIKKWLQIPSLSQYEQYINNWHSHVKSVETAIDEAKDLETEKAIAMKLLTAFYVTPYDHNTSFYEQYYERIAKEQC